MNNQMIAVDIVELSKKIGFDKPMKTQFYPYFCGMLYGKGEIIEYNWATIATISNKQWQEAKCLVYGDTFEFKQPAEKGDNQ